MNKYIFSHVDCEHKMDNKKVGDTFNVSKGIPNPTLELFTANYQRVSDASDIEPSNREYTTKFISWLNKFDYSEIDIKKVTNSWHPSKMDNSGESKEFIKCFKKHRVETIFEDIRQKKFPNMISRLECIFLTKDLDDWKWFCELPNIFEFTISSNSKFEKLDSEWFTNSITLEYSEIEQRAINYWSMVETKNPIFE